MHGRLTLALTLSTLALTAPAAHATTAAVGPGALDAPTAAASSCGDSRCTVIATDAAAPFDGVVVRWRVRTAGAATTLRLRTVQPVGGEYVATATGGDETVQPGATREFAARVPIARGGLLAVDGTSVPAGQATIAYGSGGFDDAARRPATSTSSERLQLAADVESDADGDGYGDDTQDACPGNGTDHDLPCTTTRTLGSPLTAAPDQSRGCPPGCDFLQAGIDFGGATPEPVLVSPIDGILTSWRIRQAATAGYRVQVLRPRAGGYDVVGTAGPAATGGDAALAVKQGDRLGLVTSAPTFTALRAAPGDVLQTLSATGAPSGAEALRLLLQAHVETDLDSDNKGDATQDKADLQVTVAAPASAVVGGELVHTYTVRNAGPDAALRVTWPGGGAERIAPGQAVDVPVAVASGTVGQATSSFSASAMTPDPQAGDNAASASTLITPPSLPPPPVQFVVKPCANTIRGSRDDDLLRGTIFGDRLVGGDGKDFLKGGPGDDCLEGGQGGDVLDGEAGNDRLNGSLGNDRLAGGTGNDRLTGSRGNDRLTGGPGDDVIAPGDGKDIVSAGAGNDTISARDGLRESIDCGAGRDTVRADRVDKLRGCEKVSRR
jgi:Ca2+-binding RTX toxin-like protein